MGWRELDASANESLRRFYGRSGWEPVTVDMPFDELIQAESDGEDGEVGEYEIRQRMIGVKAFFRFLKSRGVHPAEMLMQLAAAGRAIHEAPFDALTMSEAGGLFGLCKASHSWRCMLIAKEIELSGMKGSKLPGQKSKDARESYRIVQQGNTNRRGGKKAKKKSNGAKRP